MPTFDSVETTLTESDGTSCVITVPANRAAGDVLIAYVGTVAPGGTLVVPGDFTDFYNVEPAEGSWWSGFRVVTGSEPATYTWTYPTLRKNIGAILLYKDVDASPIDVDSHTLGVASTTQTMPDVTTIADNALVLRAILMRGPDAETANFSFLANRVDIVNAAGARMKLLVWDEKVQTPPGATGTVTVT